MILLGIDPGTERVGYGVLQKNGNALSLLEAGILKVKSKNTANRLFEIKRGMDAIILKHKPEVMAIEKLYFVKNQTTAMSVAEARGVILLAAREQDLEIIEFTPTEIKMGVAGYGNADKTAVLKMVKLILKAPDLAVIDDASDALAAAIVAAGHMRR